MEEFGRNRTNYHSHIIIQQALPGAVGGIEGGGVGGEGSKI